MVVPRCNLEPVQYPTLRVSRYRGGRSTGLPVGPRHAARVSHFREADTPVRRVGLGHAASVIHPFPRVIHLSDGVRHHFMGVTDDPLKVMHHHLEETHHLDMVMAPIPEEMPPIAKNMHHLGVVIHHPGVVMHHFPKVMARFFIGKALSHREKTDFYRLLEAVMHFGTGNRVEGQSPGDKPAQGNALGKREKDQSPHREVNS